jgi:hypothetical protein
MKRFWVFTCYEYEASIGLLDFKKAFDDRELAIALARTGEWGAVFDSKTGKQCIFIKHENDSEEWNDIMNMKGE